MPATWGYGGHGQAFGTMATWGLGKTSLPSGWGATTDQWMTWMLEGEYWLNPSDVAWATFGLWWEDELGPPVRPRILRFFAKRPVVRLYVKLKKKESGIDE